MTWINKAMTETFGTRWSVGEDTLARWRRALQELTVGEVRQGLEAALPWAIEHNGRWPPVLVDFLALCRPAQAGDPLYRRLQQADEARRLAPPAKASNPETAKRHLGEIRGMLGRAKR